MLEKKVRERKEQLRDTKRRRDREEPKESIDEATNLQVQNRFRTSRGSVQNGIRVQLWPGESLRALFVSFVHIM